ncbi:hypothetical protein KGP36_07425 [Patescibacteria group bacterium]|nr:hypothetical protein [Patescibacteria group bacterium]
MSFERIDIVTAGVIFSRMANAREKGMDARWLDVFVESLYAGASPMEAAIFAEESIDIAD